MVPRPLWLQGRCPSSRASCARWLSGAPSVPRETLAFSLPVLDVFCVELGVYSHVWQLFLSIQLLLGGISWQPCGPSGHVVTTHLLGVF